MRQETYPRQWKWPKGEKIAMSVGLAFEAFNYRSQFSNSTGHGVKVDHFSISYGDYGWKQGVWRLMDLLDKVGLKGNMSVNGLAAERHPEIVAMVAKLGHEINGHGWANDHIMKDDNPEEEEQEIARCTKVLTEAAGVAPVGWTSPGSAGSRNTLTMLKRAGYLWNGDDASDDLPFLRDSDLGPMVMMPRTNTPHNDLSMWLGPRNPPSIIWEHFKASFDTLYAEGEVGWPKWTEITIHCHIGARPALQPVLKQCFEYAKSHDGVWFARRRDIAEYAMKFMTEG